MCPFPVGSQSSALRGVRELLLRTGYIDSFFVFGAAHLRLARLREMRDALPAPTRALVRLFLLEETLSHAELAPIMGDGALAELERCGLLRAEADGVHSGGLLLLPMAGVIAIVPSWRLRAAAAVGDEALLLGARMGPPRDRRCADLGPGPAIAALLDAFAGGQPVAVVSDDESWRCTAWSAALNGIDQRIDLRRGDLTSGLRPGERFDFITAALPAPTHDALAAMPLGCDGRLLRLGERLREHLDGQGTARIISSCLHPKIDAALGAALAQELGSTREQIVVTCDARALRRSEIPDNPAVYPLIITISRGARQPQVQVSSLRSDGFYHLASRALRELPAIAAVCVRHGLAVPRPDDFHKVGLATIFTSGTYIVKLEALQLPDRFTGEAAALRHIRGRLEAATPEVIFEGEVCGWRYLILTKVEGCPLAEIAHLLDSSERQQIAAQIGRILSQLHGLPADVSDGLPSDWSGFLATRLRACEMHHSLHGVRPEWLARIPEMLRAAEPLVAPQLQPAFLHADASAENILVNKRDGVWQCAGLVDFGAARLGAWEYDLIVPAVQFCRDDATLAALCAGYGLADHAAMRSRITALAWLHESVVVTNVLAQCAAPSTPHEQLADQLWPGAASTFSH